MKKEQAAIEFLMTYGWAILVVLAALSALFYFGILSPDRFLPEKCMLPSGMACLDFQTTDEGFNLAIQNTMPCDMENVVLTINEINNIHTYCSESSVSLLKEGEIINFFIPCEFNNKNYKFKGEIIITYTNPITGFNHTKTGELIARI